MKLFNLNFCSGFFEFALELLSLSLGNFLLQSGGFGTCLVNKILGLFKSESEGFLDSLDDSKLSLSE